ncbi:hypothetical protein [Croceivirga sp. JEA036]|uniref:hypothetical protein n=1 Tax=Croceivirga sp. JEA036 TaxID=2721162 RepID=UPI00143A56B5|nr:hypothetical protein [Croceivirga sp. JEA036]NJB38183.1 hypothetical protein [Croceivirga sp. JEA036]
MNAKELRKYLNNSFKEKLTPYGFKKNGAIFYLMENGKSYSISFNSLNYDNSYPTSFFCFSGFIEVEKKYMELLNKNEKEIAKTKISSQLYTNQAYLFDQKKYHCSNYDLYTFDEAEKAVLEIVEYYTKIILPNFKKIETINDLDSWFNAKEYMPNSRRLKIDIIYGLLVAKLVSNPNYDILKIEYRKLSSHFSEWDRNDLNQAIEKIESNIL